MVFWNHALERNLELPDKVIIPIIIHQYMTYSLGGFVKNARARLTLVNEINSSCLEGLNEYGYIWVIFIFHVGLNEYNNKKTKVAPPKLDGVKKGVFATRSPHRYNPIGLSIAKLDKIEGRTITISGIDLIHGTPVLDIKPYHYLDSLDKS